jgi:peptidoglycan/LPS O-acetylase OafA/YrhL
VEQSYGIVLAILSLVEIPVASPTTSRPAPGLGKFRYRPEIDGLRAIAVVAVVLFHMGFGCTGGFVGVDVFFVISGFLITSLIWKDLVNGRFSIVGFWERRARRIVPAAVVVTVATMIAGWFFLLPSDFADLGRAVAAQAAFVANVFYWKDSGYFDGASSSKPLLHTWTLAVEEQFYLVIPLLLWALYRSKALRGRKSVVGILALGFVLSLAASLYGVVRSPTATFYLLPTRAWELLLGSLLAFFPVPPAKLSRRGRREALSVLGLVLILVPVFLYSSATPFPGLAALSPCLGAALVIWANGRAEGDVTTTVGTLLSLRPMVFIGLISYSFYLWHWPMMAFGNYLALTPMSVGVRVALMGFGFLCAVLSWKYVETPFRTKKWGATRKSMFACAGAGLAAVFAGGVLFVVMKGVPQRYTGQAREFAAATSDTGIIGELSVADIRGGKLVPLGVKDPRLHPADLVWGDSHAMAMLTAFDTYLREKGLAGRAATHSSTPPVLDWTFAANFGLEEDAVPFGDAVVDYIQRERIRDVVLIGSWEPYLTSATNAPGSFDAALLATVRRLASLGCNAWVMLDTPRYDFNVPRALASPIYSRAYVESIEPHTPKWGAGVRDKQDFSAQIEAAGGRPLDPTSSFQDPSRRHYMLESRGVPLYYDTAHLTAKGANLVIVPFLQKSLQLQRAPSVQRDGKN